MVSLRVLRVLAGSLSAIHHTPSQCLVKLASFSSVPLAGLCDFSVLRAKLFHRGFKTVSRRGSGDVEPQIVYFRLIDLCSHLMSSLTRDSQFPIR
ncbi:hypothetical protein F4778DRAFT_392721 [Xylariomycetidae sp. FL2044]|nr:hypothetical protein F4778DRAFT_392721 [Xylariomycetidae sp. FL2044]